jgi:chromosome segregation ATPase
LHLRYTVNSEKIIDLESRLQLKEGVEAELRRLIGNLETDLEGQKKTISKIQPKFRRAINDRGRAQSEREAAKSQVTVLTDRLEVCTAEVSRLKEVVEALTIELTTARTALTSSTVPETAELAKAQADVTSLRADKGRLEKRISMMEQDFEFTRDSYQKASSAAAELGNELLALKNEMENLQRKASENIIRVAEIQRSNESEEREARIDELHALLSERERELWKTREELRVKSNGRRETRGTSLPQSPRMVSGALSPRPQYGRGASGSRQNSPATGEAMRESHKDPVLFLQSGSRSARWDHLV